LFHLDSFKFWCKSKSLTKKGVFLFGYYGNFVALRKNRNQMEKLSHQEEDAMQAVWKVGEGSVKSFLENMPTGGTPYTTLASTIKNLEKKGFLNSRMVGNAYLYQPAITEDEYKKKFMSGFVRDYFANSYKELVNFFVEEKKLGAKELKEIIDLIEKSGS
jgi:BlaI family transcriptional regulator, penicillinase repressor